MPIRPKIPIDIPIHELEPEHIENLGPILDSIGHEKEVHHSATLSFLVDLWINEKAKGTNANKDALKGIETIIYSAHTGVSHTTKNPKTNAKSKPPISTKKTMSSEQIQKRSNISQETFESHQKKISEKSKKRKLNSVANAISSIIKKDLPSLKEIGRNFLDKMPNSLKSKNSVLNLTQRLIDSGKSDDCVKIALQISNARPSTSYGIALQLYTNKKTESLDSLYSQLSSKELKRDLVKYIKDDLRATCDVSDDWRFDNIASYLKTCPDFSPSIYIDPKQNLLDALCSTGNFNLNQDLGLDVSSSIEIINYISPLTRDFDEKTSESLNNFIKNTLQNKNYSKHRDLPKILKFIVTMKTTICAYEYTDLRFFVLFVENLSKKKSFDPDIHLVKLSNLCKNYSEETRIKYNNLFTALWHVSEKDNILAADCFKLIDLITIKYSNHFLFFTSLFRNLASKDKIRRSMFNSDFFDKMVDLDKIIIHFIQTTKPNSSRNSSDKRVFLSPMYNLTTAKNFSMDQLTQDNLWAACNILSKLIIQTPNRFSYGSRDESHAEKYFFNCLKETPLDFSTFFSKFDDAYEKIKSEFLKKEKPPFSNGDEFFKSLSPLAVTNKAVLDEYLYLYKKADHTPHYLENLNYLCRNSKNIDKDIALFRKLFDSLILPYKLQYGSYGSYTFSVNGTKYSTGGANLLTDIIDPGYMSANNSEKSKKLNLTTRLQFAEKIVDNCANPHHLISAYSSLISWRTYIPSHDLQFESIINLLNEKRGDATSPDTNKQISSLMNSALSGNYILKQSTTLASITRIVKHNKPEDIGPNLKLLHSLYKNPKIKPLWLNVSRLNSLQKTREYILKNVDESAQDAAFNVFKECLSNSQYNHFKQFSLVNNIVNQVVKSSKPEHQKELFETIHNTLSNSNLNPSYFEQPGLSNYIKQYYSLNNSNISSLTKVFSIPGFKTSWLDIDSIGDQQKTFSYLFDPKTENDFDTKAEFLAYKTIEKYFESKDNQKILFANQPPTYSQLTKLNTLIKKHYSFFEYEEHRSNLQTTMVNNSISNFISNSYKKIDGISDAHQLLIYSSDYQKYDIAIYQKLLTNKKFKKSRDHRRQIKWYFETNSNLDDFINTINISNKSTIFNNLSKLNLVKKLNKSSDFSKLTTEKEFIVYAESQIQKLVEKHLDSSSTKTFLKQVEKFDSDQSLDAILSLYSKYDSKQSKLVNIGFAAMVNGDFDKIKFPTLNQFDELDYLTTDQKKELKKASTHNVFSSTDQLLSWKEDLSIEKQDIKASQSLDDLKSDLNRSMDDLRFHLRHFFDENASGSLESKLELSFGKTNDLKKVEELANNSKKGSTEFIKAMNLKKLLVSLDAIENRDVSNLKQDKPQLKKVLWDLEQSTKAICTRIYHLPKEQLASVQPLLDIEGLNRLLVSESTAISLKSLKVYDSADPVHLILAGKEPANSGSCQRYDGTPSLMIGLLGYWLNQNSKIIRVENQDGLVLARAMLKAVSINNKPALMLERTYYDNNRQSSNSSDLIIELAKKKSDHMKIPLASASASFGVSKSLSVTKLSGLSHWEYSDALGGVIKGSTTKLMSVSIYGEKYL
jgi:hypothetical protein